MTKEELIREIVRCKIREARLKKGYEVKGNGAEKVFIPLMLTFRAFLRVFRFDMYGDTDPHRYVTAIPARGCV